MKKTFLCVTSTALLVMAMQAAAAPARHPGGGAYRVPSYAGAGYHGHPVGRLGWHGGYRGPGIGVYYGPGWGYWGASNYAWRWGYGFPYAYAYPYPVGYPLASIPLVINTTPITQTYIQQEPIAEAAIGPAPTGNYWYYCTQPAGYFPYVQNCSQPWMKVIPQSPVNPQ
jgi:hypothetical protein